MTVESLLLLITAIASLLNLLLSIRARLEKITPPPTEAPTEPEVPSLVKLAYEELEKVQQEKDKEDLPEVVLSALRFVIND